MVRTTVLLPDRLKGRAVRQARRLGMSLGEYIRVSLATTLEQSPRRPNGTRRVKGTILEMPTFDGPPPHDVSTRVDEFLYGNADR